MLGLILSSLSIDEEGTLCEPHKYKKITKLWRVNGERWVGGYYTHTHTHSYTYTGEVKPITAHGG